MLPHETNSVAFVLFDGFSNMVLASAMEPLRDVKRRLPDAALDWRVATLDGQTARSSSGLAIAPDSALSAVSDASTLMIVAGYGVRHQASAHTLAQIRTAAGSAKTVIGLDTASWLLAASGLLDDHEATIHWQELDAFQETFPRVTVSTKRYIRSGRFITCGGASTALDLSLDLIRQSFGTAAAFEASTMFLYDPERQSTLDRGASTLRVKAPPMVLDALTVMAQNIETPLSIGDIARAAATSERTLTRIFLRDLGMAPGKYYQLLRLQRARDLALETDLSIEQIALRCGFSAASSLSRAYSQTYRIQIGRVRQQR